MTNLDPINPDPDGKQIVAAVGMLAIVLMLIVCAVIGALK